MAQPTTGLGVLGCFYSGLHMRPAAVVSLFSAGLGRDSPPAGGGFLLAGLEPEGPNPA